MNSCGYCYEPTDNPKYCSRSCSAIAMNKDPEIRKRQRPPCPMGKCLRCLEPTTNPMYCSRRCAAIMNNIKSPKRKLGGRCIDCNTPIRLGGKKCGDCHKTANASHKYSTLADIDYVHLHRASAWAVVRGRVKRRVLQWGWEKICQNCGYSKHIDICHKKSISSFPSNTLIEIVNSKDNLILLCPNCHWELDHGIS